MTIRVAKVPGAKWRLVDWYIAHLPAKRCLVDDCIRSGHASHTQSCRFPSAARTGRAAPVRNRSERGRGRLRRAR